LFVAFCSALKFVHVNTHCIWPVSVFTVRAHHVAVSCCLAALSVALGFGGGKRAHDSSLALLSRCLSPLSRSALTDARLSLATAMNSYCRCRSFAARACRPSLASPHITPFPHSSPSPPCLAEAYHRHRRAAVVVCAARLQRVASGRVVATPGSTVVPRSSSGSHPPLSWSSPAELAGASPPCYGRVWLDRCGCLRWA
jgi:hypothetical protein